MKFLAVNPFIRIVVSLITGILLQHHIRMDWFILISAAGIFSLGLVLFSFLSLRAQYFFDWFRGMLIGLLFTLAGSALMKNCMESQPKFGGEEYYFLAEVIDIPREKPRTWQAILRMQHDPYKNTSNPSPGKILTYFQKEDTLSPVKPGDKIIARGYLHPITNYGNPAEFDYRLYMASRGIGHQCYLEKQNWKKVKDDRQISLIALSNRIRSHLLGHLEAGIRETDRQAVAAALLLGYKGGLTPEMKSSFSASGTMHILAVSGLHVGILYLVFHYLMIFMDRYRHGRMVKTGIIILALAGYAFLTGLSPSVCRATAMFSIIALGRSMRRSISTYNSLAFSAFLLLVINPMLIFSVSFQLSYAAVASIAFFQPRLYSLFQLRGIPDKLWQWLTLAIAAQIGAAPLIILYFHTFPNYFWLSNFIAVPAAIGIILTGIGYLITLPLLPAVSKVMQAPLNFFLEGLTRATRIIENFPCSASEELWISAPGVILAYMFIVLFTAFLIRRHTIYLTGSLTLVIFYLALNIASSLIYRNQQELIIYNAPKASAINYRGWGSNVLYLSGNRKPQEIIRLHIRNYWLSRGLDQYCLEKLPGQQTMNQATAPGPQHFIQAGHWRIAYLHGGMDLSALDPDHPLCLDYLVLAGDADITIGQIDRCFKVKQVILDSSNSWYIRRRWWQRLRQRGYRVHSIPEQGAFRMDLDQKIDKKIGLL